MESMTMKTTQALLAFSVAANVLLLSATGLAQSYTERTAVTGPAEFFGAKGQIAISSDAALSIQRSTTTGVSGGTTTLQLAPALDYFLIQNLSLGGMIGLDYVTSGDNHSSRLSIGPRVGYNFTLSDLISVWPKLGTSFAWTSSEVSASPSTGEPSSSSTGNNIALNVFVPVVFHPAKHFFVGFGPFIDTDLTSDARTTVWGGKLTLGGWL
jgi:hypothetical protein